MLPLLLSLLVLVTSQSLIPQALGQDEFAFGRRVPRRSDLANPVSLPSRKLFSLQGRQKESDDLSIDLTPQAQSYFIEPELPTTTSVRPMFKRRKTLRPISTVEAERRKQVLADAAESDKAEELPAKIPFKPFRQIHNTGFSKQQRPSGSQRQRSRVQTENTNQNNEHANNINYELNEIPTTTEGQFEPTPSKEGDNGNINSGRTFLPGRRKKINPTFAPQIKIGRPNRFQSRRNFKASATPSETPGPVTEANQPESSQPTRNLNRNGGRQGFVLRPKPQGLESSNGENRTPLRRRKKPTTEVSTLDDQSVQNTIEHGQVSELPTARKVPSDPNPITISDDTPFQPRRNNGFQRRPNNLRAKQSRPSESDAAINPEGSVRQSQISDFPVSMSMRLRPSGTRAPLLDSEHESSDAVAVVAERNPEEVVAPNTDSESPADTYRPRNLSQRAKPLDKLSNRQAASRRFLTPKKSDGTTVAPVVVITSKPGRRSPLSLQNLRNRRLGKPDVTTTTEAAPVVEEAAAVESNNSTSVSGTEPAKDHIQPEFDAEDKKEDSSDIIEGTKDSESEVPKVQALPGRKRPLLPGQRKPLVGRIPLISKPKVVTTTPTPAQETTPTPTCEEGKRYNKVLRKCIPPFAPRSG